MLVRHERKLDVRSNYTPQHTAAPLEHSLISIHRNTLKLHLSNRINPVNRRKSEETCRCCFFIRKFTFPVYTEAQCATSQHRPQACSRMRPHLPKSPPRTQGTWQLGTRKRCGTNSITPRAPTPSALVLLMQLLEGLVGPPRESFTLSWEVRPLLPVDFLSSIFVLTASSLAQALPSAQASEIRNQAGKDPPSAPFFLSVTPESRCS